MVVSTSSRRCELLRRQREARASRPRQSRRQLHGAGRGRSSSVCQLSARFGAPSGGRSARAGACGRGQQQRCAPVASLSPLGASLSSCALGEQPSREELVRLLDEARRNCEALDAAREASDAALQRLASEFDAFKARQPPESAFKAYSALPPKLSPSDFGKTWLKYQFAAKREPPYACFRPPLAPPRALPASLVDPLFGRFLDALSTPLDALDADDVAAASAAAVALCDAMPLRFPGEASRQDELPRILSGLVGERVAEFSPAPSRSRARTDGGLLVRGVGAGAAQADALALLVEVKNELGSRAGEPMAQGARTAELFWQEPQRAVLRARAGACPCLLLEVVGPLLRVHALALLPDGGVLAEPLTHALNCLPLKAQRQALDALVAALAALRAATRELTALYRAAADATQPAPRPPAAGTQLPWPLRDAAAWSASAHLGGGKLLYEALAGAAPLRGVPPGTRVIVKFVPRRYGADVHAAWAAAGLAPALHSMERLPGDLFMVVMAALTPQDGWLMLMMLPPGDADEAAARAAALAALAAAHAVPLPSGTGVQRHAAHGDCRGANVFVRAAPGAVPAWEVRFVDFDWAGEEGLTRYPTLMSADVAWPLGARPGALLSQAHDADLLARA